MASLMLEELQDKEANQQSIKNHKRKHKTDGDTKTRASRGFIPIHSSTITTPN